MAGRDVELDLIGHDHTGHATRSAAGNLDQLRRKLGKFNVETNANLKRGMLRTGIQAGSSFVQGFLKTISGGMLGRGTLGMAAKMSPGATAAGIVVGALLASKVLATAHAAILAGLPLILGAGIVAGPIAHLVVSEKARVKALKERIKNARKELGQAGLSESEQFRLKTLQAQSKLTKSEQARLKQLQDKLKSGKGDQAKLKGIISESQGRLASSWLTKLKTKWDSFTKAVSKPIKAPFLAALKEVGSGLDRLKGPFADLVKAMGPVLKPLTKGVFDGIIGFVEALKPAMPGITAGLKEWGRQLPIIMTAFGDAFAAILKDPDKVQAAVRTIGDAVVWVADSLPGFVDGVKMLSNALKGLLGPIGLILPGFTATWRGAVTIFWSAVLAILKGTTLIVGAMAIFNPAMRVPLAGLRALLAGAELTFNGIKDKWAATDAAVRKREIVAKITATIDDLETKIAAAKAKLKTVHNAKARAKIEATIKDLQLKQATAKALLHQYQGTRSVAKLKADKKDLETKIAASKASLKTVHDSKTRAKIKADIAQAQGAISTINGQLNSLNGKVAKVYIRTIKTTLNRGENAPGGGTLHPGQRAAGDSWAGAAGGSYRTGGPRVVLGDTNVDSRVFIDGRELRAMARSTVIDETRRNAHRARVGRR